MSIRPIIRTTPTLSLPLRGKESIRPFSSSTTRSLTARSETQHHSSVARTPPLPRQDASTRVSPINLEGLSPSRQFPLISTGSLTTRSHSITKTSRESTPAAITMKNSAKTARLPIQDDTLIHKRGLRLPPLNDNFSAQQTSETAVQTPIQSPTSVLVDFSSRNDFSIDSHQQTTTTTSKIPSSSQSVSSRQNLSQTPTIKRTSTYTASKVGRLSRPTTSVTNTSTHSSQRSVGGRRTRQSRPSTKSRVQSATTKKKEPHPFEEREFSRMIFSPSSRFFHTEMVNVFLPDHNHPANPEIDKLDTYSSLPTPQSRQPLTLSLDDFSKWRPHYYLKSAWDGKIAQLDGSFNNLSQQQLRYRQTAKGVVYTPNESSSDKESPDPHSFYLAESLNHDSDVYRLQLIHRKLLQHRNCLGQDTLPIASPPLPKQPCQSATDISKLYSSLVSSIFFHQPLPLLSYERVFLTEEKRKLDESRRSVKIPQKTKQRIWK